MSPPRDPHSRTSTDQGLADERRRTDVELASRTEMREAATTVTEARDKADAVLADARELEDEKVEATASLTKERVREDAALEGERSDADTVVRDENERRLIALASLLAFERETTNLRLELERENVDRALTAREDFMAMVSHDLRSLLGGIALSAELLKEVGNAEQPMVRVIEYAERIQRFSARMNRLVGDLVDVASIEAGKLALVRVRRPASMLLRDARDAFEPAARSRDIELRCDPAGDTGFVESDHERLLQVLTNLVGNSLKFTLAGGSIVIRAERHANEVRYSVTDTGIGVPADQLTQIFDRYFQTASGDRRGLGLGLYIARSIVEGHGGKIWAERSEPGTTFFFTIPSCQ